MKKLLIACIVFVPAVGFAGTLVNYYNNTDTVMTVLGQTVASYRSTTGWLQPIGMNTDITVANHKITLVDTGNVCHARTGIPNAWNIDVKLDGAIKGTVCVQRGVSVDPNTHSSFSVSGDSAGGYLAKYKNDGKMVSEASLSFN